MRYKIIKSLLITATLTCILSLPAFAANDGAGIINANSIKLYSSAVQGSVVKTAAKSSPVVVINRDNSDWYKVWYSGCEGYISSSYIDFFADLNVSFGKGTIRGSAVRLRSEAGTNSATLGYYNTGAVMDVIGVSGVWYKVNCNGTLGYVHSDFMALRNQYIPICAYSTEGEIIVSTAMQYIGVTYTWGGTTPKGFDCSGFVYYVFQENGYKTNRTAAYLYNNGSYVERSQLKAGDIICFYNGEYSYIGHVGIYIGNNQFIHASSSNGKVVVDSLSTNYYNKHYYGARRIAE